MKQTLVEVLIHLFHNAMKDNQNSPEALEHAKATLDNMELSVEELEQACQEISDSGLIDTDAADIEQHALSTRVYSLEECAKLDTECRGLLVALEQLGLLSPENREAIIDQVLESTTEHVEFDEFKWFVLFTILKDESLTTRIANSETVLTHKDLSEQLH